MMVDHHFLAGGLTALQHEIKHKLPAYKGTSYPISVLFGKMAEADRWKRTVTNDDKKEESHAC